MGYMDNLKKIICILFMGLCIIGICTAQEQENLWFGTLRFDITDNFINLHNALPGMSVTWTQYIMQNLGIPVEIDTHIGWGVLPGVQIALLSGIEYIPIGPADKDKNGILLTAKIGLSLFILKELLPTFVTKANIGYQYISEKGFVFTPAAGAVYNQRTGLGLNIILDIGFAYMRKGTK